MITVCLDEVFAISRHTPCGAEEHTMDHIINHCTKHRPTAKRTGKNTIVGQADSSLVYSRGGQYRVQTYRGTFLVPIPVPTVFFQKCYQSTGIAVLFLKTYLVPVFSVFYNYLLIENQIISLSLE